MFAAMGISGFDPINGAYSADGSGMDGVLDNLSINVNEGNINIVNVNTGQSVVSVSVANAGTASIPASVAAEVAAYVSEGPSTFEAVKAFLNDFFFTRSRSYGSYYSSSLDWLNGNTRASILANTTFPVASNIDSLKDITIVKRDGLDRMTVYYVVKLKDGTMSANTAWLVRENGKWYFGGNGLKFSRKISPVSVMEKSASGEAVNAGLEFNFADNGQQGGIQIFSVKGPPGLPSEGIHFYAGNDGFVYDGTSTAPLPYIYYMTDTQANEANSSFMLNGFIKYTIEAYTDYVYREDQTGMMVFPSGSVFQTDEYMLRAPPVKTPAGIANDLGLFVRLENFNYFKLEDLLTRLTGNMQTSADTIEDFSYGVISFECLDAASGTSTTFSHSITPSAPDFNYSLNVSNTATVEHCKSYLVYFDSIFRKYMSYTVFERDVDSATIQALSTAAAGLKFDTIKGTNTSSGDVTDDLVLPSTLRAGFL